MLARFKNLSETADLLREVLSFFIHLFLGVLMSKQVQTGDTAALSFSGKQKQQKKKAFLFFLATNLIFFSALFSLNNYGFESSLFVLKDTSWKQVEDLPGTPLEIATTENGAVWISHVTPDGISRFDGTQWQNFRYQDIGFAPEEFFGSMYPQGDQLWLWVGSDVFHFNGKSWQRFANVSQGNEIVDLSPGEKSTWVVDAEANLYQFDGTSWKGSSLEEWGVKLSEDEKFMSSFRLAQSKSGSLWFVSRQSVWRFNETWQQLLDSNGLGGTPILLGSSGDVLWLASGDEIIRIAEQGKQLKRFTAEQFGLSDLLWLVPINVTEEAIWMQRDQQIIAYNGEQPQLVKTLPTLPEGYTNIFRILSDRDGTLWAQAEAGGMLSSSTILLGFLGLWVIIVMAERAFKRSQQTQQQAHVKEVLEQSVPSVESGGQLYLSNTALGANEGIGSGSILGRIARYTYNVTLYGAALIAYPFLSAGIDSLTGGMLPGWTKNIIVIFLAIFTISFVRIKLGSIWIISPAHRGKYEKALKRLHLARHFVPELAAVFETAFLYYSQRYEECSARAMVHLEQFKTQDATLKSLVLATHCASLVALGKYAEAEKACRGALELNPGSATILACLADTYLFRGESTQQALEILDQALEGKSMSDPGVAAEVLGSRAWALAASGRGAEAEAELEKAFGKVPRSRVHETAMLLYRAARVNTLLGKRNEAQDMLQDVRRMDPQGVAGDLASKFLEREFKIRASASSASKPPHSTPVGPSVSV